MPEGRVIRWDPLASDPLDLGRIVVSIGVFDGVHAGHRYLLDGAARAARDLDATLVTLTFERDPDELFSRGDGLCRKLLSNEERIVLLADVTSSVVVVLSATDGLFALAPGAFLGSFAKLGDVRDVHVGVDFRFGARASGTVSDIVSACESHGAACHPTELLEMAGGAVTATRIRGLVACGKVADAAELLGGRRHAVRGTVVHGRGAGEGLGFATANLVPAEGGAMLPAEGVYGGYARVLGTVVDGAAAGDAGSGVLCDAGALGALDAPGAGGARVWPAAINVGAARSFEGATSPVEAHLVDFDGGRDCLYGRVLEVSFAEWLRGPRVFGSREELIDTVTANIDWVRRNL